MRSERRSQPTPGEASRLNPTFQSAEDEVGSHYKTPSKLLAQAQELDPNTTQWREAVALV